MPREVRRGEVQGLRAGAGGVEAAALERVSRGVAVGAVGEGGGGGGGGGAGRRLCVRVLLCVLRLHGCCWGWVCWGGVVVWRE